MFKVDLAQTALQFVVGKTKLLDRRQSRVWNRDSNLRQLATALAIEKYEADKTVVKDLGEDEESGLLRFLEWLIEHQDEIKALIEMIMSLFNDVEEKNVV